MRRGWDAIYPKVRADELSMHVVRRPHIFPILFALVWALGFAPTAMGAFSWNGTWSTTFGEMRLTETVDATGARTVTGPYDYVPAPGRIDGTVTGDVLTGTWLEQVPFTGTGKGPLAFTMSQDGLSFTGLWNNEGLQPTLAWNGSRPTAPTPLATPVPVATPVPNPAVAQGTCTSVIKGTSVDIVTLVPTRRFESSCGVMRRAAENRLPGWVCSAPRQRANGTSLITCSQTPRPAVPPPVAVKVCSPVMHNSRRYKVWKWNVTCRYARNTALKMLRRQDPFIYEFVQSGQQPRWGCLIFGRGTTERGSCFKQFENRFIVYFPA